MKPITCPYCNKTFELSDALQHEVKEQLEKEHKSDMEKARNEEQAKVEKKMREEMEVQLRDIENERKQKEQRIEKLMQELLKANEEMRELKQKDEEREIENQKKLQADRDRIKEEISKFESEKSHLKLAELQKQLDDTKKALGEAQRKSEQVSQQLQGEVLELHFEELLHEMFPSDEILPVKKGEVGADIRHIVKSPKGYACGTILWEFKRTKDWSDKWTKDLKEKLRNEQANIPVIVSVALPKDISNLGLKDGVWVATQELVIPLAELLRKNLLEVAYQKAVLANKTGKADMLYSYVTSDTFVHQVQSILETYFDMKTQITKEKGAFERLWKTREEQIEKIFRSTAQIAGSISGTVGASMPQIKGLDLLESGDMLPD